MPLPCARGGDERPLSRFCLGRHIRFVLSNVRRLKVCAQNACVSGSIQGQYLSNEKLTMARYFAIVIAISIATGCAAPAAPKPVEFEKSRSFDGSFDSIWPSVVAAFASFNVPIKNIEKDSGLIVAEQAIPNEGFADCGKGGVTKTGFQERIADRFGVYNLQVRDNGRQQSVTVNASFTANVYRGRNKHRTVTCFSNGSFEQGILDFIASDL